MKTSTAGQSPGEFLPCLLQVSVFRIQKGHLNQLVDSISAPYMTLISLVVATTCQAYMLLFNMHEPPIACAASPLCGKVPRPRHHHGKSSIFSRHQSGTGPSPITANIQALPSTLYSVGP